MGDKRLADLNEFEIQNAKSKAEVENRFGGIAAFDTLYCTDEENFCISFETQIKITKWNFSF